MTWYKTGTVAVAPGSNAVIGTGTSFIANARVGDAFRGPDGEWYEVTNIASNTALSIAPVYQGAAVADGVYSLAPMQGYVKDSADALRAATQVFASGVADMQEQVATATEAAESAGQSKTVATEQAGIANSAATTSTDNKNAAQLAAQQSSLSAQASGAAADRAETAKNSIVQSEQAAAASAAAAAESAEHAEEVTQGKAASGANTDITSLGGLTTPLSVSQGGTGSNSGVADMVGASTTLGGTKGLVPAPASGVRRFLTSLGTWVQASEWGYIGGTLANQVDIQTALDSKPTGNKQQLSSAWVCFNGTGTPSIYGSHNVASITRIGTGIFRINFAVALDNTNFAIAGCASDDSAVQIGFYENGLNKAARTASSVTIVTAVPAGSTRDMTVTNVIVLGGKN
ncbi:hypothetical protein ACSSUR_24270 [Pseudomonas cedrina]|uniref:hypothetical protein n=1 Tax=Pseudomonas cedrina TaxID=651740 RepID=UPI003EDABD7E